MMDRSKPQQIMVSRPVGGRLSAMTLFQSAVFAASLAFVAMIVFGVLG